MAIQELTTPGVLARFRVRLARASQRLLVLDYDGTLAPFAAERHAVRMYPGVARHLRRIADTGTAIAFVTGRSARELAACLPWSGMEIFGAHGRERLTRDGRLEQLPLAAEVLRALDCIDRQLVASGLGDSIERKHGTLAVHWRRQSPDQQRRTDWQVRKIAQSLPDTIVMMPFDGGIEFCSPGASKGTALTALLKHHAGAVCAYLGDDMTDEDAFAALPPGGLGVLVRSDVRTTGAAVWLRPPEDLLAFFTMWQESTATRS